MWERVELETKHPYVSALVNSLQLNFNVINYGKKLDKGILDTRKYFSNSEIFFFNWVENLSWLQTLIFLSFFLTAKIFNKKIAWAHHNIHPHAKDSLKSKLFIKFLSKNCDFVVLHTRESLNYIKPGRRNKFCYYFHPFFTPANEGVAPLTGKKYEVLIWGTMRKSKGLEDFFNYLKEKNLLNKYKIKVIGKFESKEYYNDFISKYSGTNIQFQNCFIEKQLLEQLHNESEYVFFPYTGGSVLNSGALVTSLPFKATIIGPAKGAFKELKEEGLILNYNSFSDVINLLEKKEEKIDMQRVELFCKQHTWKGFSDYFKSEIEK